MTWISVSEIVDSRTCVIVGCPNEATHEGDRCSLHHRPPDAWVGGQGIYLHLNPNGGGNLMPVVSEVSTLISHIRRAGYKVTKSGNAKHWKVLKPNGAVLVDKNGPVIISTTPSETRFREMTVQRLMSTDPPVFKKDPYKATPSNPAEKGLTPEREKRSGKGVITDEMRARARAGAERKSEEYRERTAKIRARWEPILAKLGGWQRVQHGPGVSKVDFGRAMTGWAGRRGRVELPKKTQRGTPMNEGAIQQIVNNFSKGGTLGDVWAPLFEVFIDALERGSGTPPDPSKSAEHYREFLREEKGISPGPQSPAAGPPASEEPLLRKPVEAAPLVVDEGEPETEVRIEGPDGEVRIVPLKTSPAPGPVMIEVLATVEAPRLAMEVLYEMAVRAHPADADARERHLALAREIAELELNKPRRDS